MSWEWEIMVLKRQKLRTTCIILYVTVNNKLSLSKISNLI